MTRTLSIAAILLASLLWAQSGETFKPGKLSKAEQAALVPGLTMRFIEGGKALDARQVRLAALHVPEKTPPSPLLKAGPFSATLSGYLKAPLRSEYQFQLVAKGKAELTVNGKTILAANDQTTETTTPIELARGFNKIEIAFTAPAAGEATVRVGWSGEGFNLEPLPPDALFSRGDDADLVSRTQFREGRSLFATHGCQRCHGLPNGVTATAEAMPELQQQAPSLETAGSRFGQAWMARWILNPRELRPQATMPALLHGDIAPQQAADVAAYLSSLKTDVKEAAKGDVETGEKLFNSLGCLACHHVNEAATADAFERLPLHLVKEKYQPAALAEFLQAPHRHYAWSRMPDFKLTPADAAHLAAFLRDRAKGTLEPVLDGNAERGKTLFDQVGCANCHVLKTGTFPADGKRRPFPGKDSARGGCLADDDAARKSAPNFRFDNEQTAALRAFFNGDVRSLAHETPAEFSQRQMANLKCNACHRRDGATSRWFQVMEEEGGSLPENLPLLTWAGEKLQPAWTQKLLAGGIDHRARPWLKARMPAFPARADLLSVGLTHEHGFGLKENDRPAADPKLAEIGHKLLPQIGGLNCVQCHGVGNQPPVAPFEAPGINLLDAAQRLRYSYYQRWMLDPPRLDPTTKMVKLAPDGKTTGLHEVFDGDAKRQFDAIWHFIQTLR